MKESLPQQIAYYILFIICFAANVYNIIALQRITGIFTFPAVIYFTFVFLLTTSIAFYSLNGIMLCRGINKDSTDYLKAVYLLVLISLIVITQMFDLR